jgi:hypothetical protein
MIAKFKDGEEYAAAITKLEQEQSQTWLVKALTADSYALGKIAHAKSQTLRVALGLTGLGGFLTFIRAIFY